MVEEVCNIAHRVVLFDRGGVIGEVTGEKINAPYLNGLAAGALSFRLKEETTLKKKGISLSYIFNTYNLLIILAGVIIVFSILLPNSFPTLYNLKSILNYQAIVV